MSNEGVTMNEGATQVICRKCGDLYPPARARLGYATCLPCGDKQARLVTFCTVPMNKSNYVVISNHEELKMLNPKRTGE
jgi:hypothetical protein